MALQPTCTTRKHRCAAAPGDFADDLGWASANGASIAEAPAASEMNPREDAQAAQSQIRRHHQFEAGRRIKAIPRPRLRRALSLSERPARSAGGMSQSFDGSGFRRGKRSTGLPPNAPFQSFFGADSPSGLAMTTT